MAAASREHICTSLSDGLGPLHECCFTSRYQPSRTLNIELQLNHEDYPRSYFVELYGSSRSGDSLYLKVVTPAGHVRITKSQCILAVSLFFGLLAARSFGPEPIHHELEGDEDEDEEELVEGPDGWQAELWSTTSFDSSCSSSSSISVYTNYQEIDIKKDALSLFRALVFGQSIAREPSQKHMPAQHLVALQLRETVAKMLESRWNLETYLENDFKDYVKRVTNDKTFAGEIELSVASQVLQAPIRVYMEFPNLGGLKLIAEYGSVYEKATNNHVNLLYKGYGDDDGDDDDDAAASDSSDFPGN